MGKSIAPVAIVSGMIAVSILLFACLALLWRAEVEMAAGSYPPGENATGPSRSLCSDSPDVVCVQDSSSGSKWM